MKYLLLAILALGIQIQCFSQQRSSALNFDGMDDQVVIGADAFNVSAVTIEFWIKWDPNYLPTFICGKAYEQLEIHSGGNSGPDGIRFIPTQGVYLDAPAGSLPSNVWTHVACVYDPSISLAKLYVNGEEKPLVNHGSAAISKAITSSTEAFRLGSRINNAYFLKGSLSGFRFWNRALSQCEVKLGMSCNSGAKTNLVASYFFDDGTVNGSINPSTLKDHSGNLHDGFLQNFNLFGSTSNWTDGGISGSAICNTILAINSIKTSLNPICRDTKTEITANFSGGTLLWSDQQGNLLGSSSSITVGPGTYTATVTNCNNQSVKQSITISMVNSDAGRIGTNHTVPYPKESFTDSIVNLRDTSYGFRTFGWQQSSDNINWSNIANLNSLSYSIPAIQTSTFYRRVVDMANCPTRYSNTVAITVFTSSYGKNGKVTGRVKAKNGNGISGVWVYAQKLTLLLGSPDVHVDSVQTIPGGQYQFTNLFYGDETNGDPANVYFKVWPAMPGHKYDPKEILPLQVSGSISQTLQDFTDTTALPVSGRIYQQCTGCLNNLDQAVDTMTAGVDSVKISSNQAPIWSDAKGNYTVALSSPGAVTLTPSYKNHSFDSSYRTLNVSNPTSGIDFKDITNRTISGNLSDGSGEIIGTAILEFVEIPKGNSSLIFRKRVTTNATTGAFSVSLPAKRYKMRVIDFTSKAAETDANNYVNPYSFLTFFADTVNYPQDTLTFDIDQTDIVRNLVYHRPPVLEVVGLNDTACAGVGVVYKQNIPKKFLVRVWEGPVIKQLPIKITQDSILSNLVKLYTDVEDHSQLGTAPPATTWYKLDTPSRREITIIPGVPNTTSPFKKQLRLDYVDKYGRPAKTEMRDGVVTGMQQPTGTFVTTSPEIPLMILHRPPGDQSYSYWEQTKSAQTALRMSYANSKEIGGYVEAKIGADFSVGLGVEIKTEVEISANAGFKVNATNITDNETILETSTTSKYSTKAGGITGSGGDVYIGGAVNFKYGISNVIAFDGCLVKKTEQLIMAPKSIPTIYTYSEDHIKNTLIPSIQYIVDNTSDQVKKGNFKNQLDVWQQVVDNNRLNKQNAAFVENRSFDGSVGGVEKSVTNTETASNTITFNMAVESSVSGKIGGTVNGVGGEVGGNVTFTMETGKSTANTTTLSTTTGYLLGDLNAGDYYSVDIKKDPVYGTPVFDLVAGTSSCPPEPGAQMRDNPQIIIDNPVVNNIATNDAGFFTIKCINKSESRETRSYLLSLNTATADGLKVESSAGQFGVAPQPINNLAYDATRPVSISVKKFNQNDGITSYPDIEFILTDACDGSVVAKNTISVNFISPCGNINLVSPEADWMNKSNSIPVTFNGYTLNSVESVAIEYAKAGTSEWQPGHSWTKAQITDPATSTFPWDVTSIPDSVYNLRLKLTCSGGKIVYTPKVKGIIDRKPPFVIGKPEPADLQYVDGEEISFSYNEAINTGSLSSSNVVMKRLSNGSILPASISGFDNKIIVVPQTNLTAYNGDSIMVIVSNIGDLYGNTKTTADTSRFFIGTASAIPGLSTLTISLINDAKQENATGTMDVHFKLSSAATTLTKVNFTIGGTATYNNDYTASTDTIYIPGSSSSTPSQPAYGYFNGAQGYVYINKGASEAVLQIHTKPDEIIEPDETVIISALSGSLYNLGLISSVTANILSDECSATSLLWTGAVSQNWNVAGNWCNGAVPGNTSNVIIPPNATIIIDSAVPAIRSLNVQKDGKLIITPNNTLKVLH